MPKFDFEEFQKALEKFYEFKHKFTPYNREDWRIDNNNKKCPASKCAAILRRIATQIGYLCDDSQLSYRVIHISRGVGYFPKSPWIGIMFKNERPTNGVYPAISLQEDGFSITCVDSMANPQKGFLEEMCFTKEEFSKGEQEENPLFSHIHEHCSRSSQWFSKDNYSPDSIGLALRKVVGDYQNYRENHPVVLVTEEDDTESESELFDVVQVTDVSKWMTKIVRKNKKTDHWIYRGQGDAAWKLSSGFERAALSRGADDYGELAKDIEEQALSDFMREIQRMPEYKDFKPIDVLALMQHFGSKTRLVDFTFSPLVAMFMAIAQYDDYYGNASLYLRHHPCKKGNCDFNVKVEAIAVWCIKAQDLPLPPSQSMAKESWLKKCQAFYADANSLVDPQANPKSVEVQTQDLGIDVVLPNANNVRISAQEGLFLMARNVGQQFMSNLLATIKSIKRTKRKGLVVKYIISADQIEKLRSCLEQLYITPKLIYPDLEGLAKSVNSTIYSQSRNVSN